MPERLVNAFQTTLAEALDDSETGVDLTSAAGLPAADDFRIIIVRDDDEFEICKVTSVAGSTATVERGADGTAAITHDSGETVTAILTNEGAQRMIYDRAAPPIDRQVFTAGGTWTKPTPPDGARPYTEVEVIAIGGGAGGGAGQKLNSSGTRHGGAAGTGGALSRLLLDVADCGATETVTVGAGGAGGAGSATSNSLQSAFADGSDGGDSSFGSILYADGGVGGPGASDGVAQSASDTPNIATDWVGRGMFPGGSGSQSWDTGNTVYPPEIHANSFPAKSRGHVTGGGGGGAASGNNSVLAAGAGDPSPWRAGGAAGASSTTVDGTNGSNGASAPTGEPLGGGGGGGGGAASATTGGRSGGDGGDGGLYGGGGAGGGSNHGDAAGVSGDGGDGGAGIVVVVTR